MKKLYFHRSDSSLYLLLIFASLILMAIGLLIEFDNTEYDYNKLLKLTGNILMIIFFSISLYGRRQIAYNKKYISIRKSILGGRVIWFKKVLSYYFKNDMLFIEKINGEVQKFNFEGFREKDIIKLNKVLKSSMPDKYKVSV